MGNDPKNKLTDYMTQDQKATTERTRLMSKEQKEWYLACDTLSMVLGWKTYGQLKAQDEKAMMALQGKRSDDIVAMMKADQDQGSLNVGVEAKAKEYVKNRQEG